MASIPLITQLFLSIHLQFWPLPWIPGSNVKHCPLEIIFWRSGRHLKLNMAQTESAISLQPSRPALPLHSWWQPNPSRCSGQKLCSHSGLLSFPHALNASLQTLPLKYTQNPTTSHHTFKATTLVQDHPLRLGLLLLQEPPNQSPCSHPRPLQYLLSTAARLILLKCRSITSLFGLNPPKVLHLPEIKYQTLCAGLQVHTLISHYPYLHSRQPHWPPCGSSNKSSRLPPQGHWTSCSFSLKYCSPR